MDTILCFISKCGAGIAFAVIWCLHQLVLASVVIGKYLVTQGTNLSIEVAILLSQLKKVLSKDCPPFRWPEIPATFIVLCSTLFFVLLLGWLMMQTYTYQYQPSPPMDLSWLGWILILLLVLAIVIGLIYALRHILPWIAGILAILSLVSALASAPSCSTPSVSTVTPEKTTEYCWFYEACFWKGTSIQWPTFSFPNYCWFWEACYPGNNQGSSGSPAPIVVPSATIPEDTTQYCWFWDNCFWKQLFGSNDSVVLKPEVIEPVKAVEAKVSPPEFTEHVIQRGDTLWKLAGGDLDQVEAIALLNAGVLDPYWIKNCHHISKKTNKWCAEPKHTLQIGMRIFIPIHK